MEKDKINLINTTYQCVKNILMTTDNFINDIKNEKLQQLVIKKISEYDLILDECKILMKSNNSELIELGFFEKYQNLINLKIASLSKKNTFEISEIIYLAICEIMPKLYSYLIFTDYDELELIKKLITINEEFLSELKSYFIIKD